MGKNAQNASYLDKNTNWMSQSENFLEMSHVQPYSQTPSGSEGPPLNKPHPKVLPLHPDPDSFAGRHFSDKRIFCAVEKNVKKFFIEKL